MKDEIELNDECWVYRRDENISQITLPNSSPSPRW
jgi:hypothetical protein